MTRREHVVLARLLTTARTYAVVGAIVLGLAGCSGMTGREAGPDAPSGGLGTSPAASACRDVDVSVFALGGIADFQPMSPEELRAEADLVAEVVLEGISPGDRAGGELPFVVGELRTAEVFVDRSDVVPADGALRLRIGQGPYRGSTGEPAYQVEHFRQAVPVGTRMVVFADDPGPDGLLDTYWQGLLVDDCGVLVGGKEPLIGAWTSYRSMDDLMTFLRG
ncbi:MAG TPA: hypothetical protein VM575_11755 [Nocardioides sp.]|nr:hypothetical protein [Nocardioides sp.]